MYGKNQYNIVISLQLIKINEKRKRKLSIKELMLLNCGVGEDSRVPWTARKSNQSILKEISPGVHWKD